MTDRAYPPAIPLQEAKQDTIVEVPAQTPRHVRVARFVSYILAPSTISLPFVVLTVIAVVYGILSSSGAATFSWSILLWLLASMSLFWSCALFSIMCSASRSSSGE